MEGTVQDITKRKKIEEALASIQKARKKEIHHRIKNNLQVISSLLDLQAEKFRGRKGIKSEDVLEAFRERQCRVKSMVLIHEELHKSRGSDTVDFSSYLTRLVENLFQIYRLGNNDVSLHMDLEENIFFDMDTAIPLGMIINELVSNSLKYAFPDRAKGEIQIKLYREENKKDSLKNTSFILEVADNGVGIPESFEIKNRNSLGFQLVATLVDQLDGKLDLKRGNGMKFAMRFKLTKKKQASTRIRCVVFCVKIFEFPKFHTK
jgi:two-component sensor histidine kinase